VKRKDLISVLVKNGCVLLRHGGRHDIYNNPQTGKSQPVPRHREINERLAKRIINELSNSP
jgi:predicted RNA binding protein YcfA (HicA-like mRNA interferase family)